MKELIKEFREWLENNRPNGCETIKELFTGGDFWSWDFAKEYLIPQIEKFWLSKLEADRAELLEKIVERINTEEDTSWGDVRRNLLDYLEDIKKLFNENT